MLKQNLGKLDRTARVIFGIILIACGVYMSSNWGLVVGLIGLIPLLTGMVGNCPLYSICKINSCRIHN